MIACSKHIAPNFVGWLLHYKIIYSVNARNLPFGMAKSFKQEKYILTKGQKLPIVHSALQGMDFCLDLGPFFFFLFLFPCSVFFFYLFIYLFIDDIFPYTPRKGTTLLHTRCSLGMAHCHVWPTFGFIVCPYYLLLAFTMPMPLWALRTVIMVSMLLLTPCFRNANALVGLTHRDHGKHATTYSLLSQCQCPCGPYPPWSW